MKKYLVLIFCILIGYLASAQTFNPTIGTVSNKPYSPAQSVPTDARSYFYDATNFLWRPYQSPTEILTFLNLPKYRGGNVIYVVDSGGILNSNGSYTNFFATFYMFKDGVLDGNLVKLNLTGGGGGGGSGTVTNVSGVSSTGFAWNVINPTTTPAISLVLTGGGDLTGTWPNITVAKFNGQLPSYYQNYNNLFNQPTIPSQLNPTCVGCTISGSYPNLTWTVTGTGFNTAGVDLIALSSSTVGLDTLNYRKVDSLYTTNDSTLIYVLNGQLHSLQIRGGTSGGGGGSGTVTNVSGVNANGIAFSITNPTSTPAITISLNAITPTTVNGLTLTALTTGFTIAGGTTSKTLTVPLNATVSGTNTGDITIAGENYLSLSSQVLTANQVNVSGTNITGILKAASFPALTGDVTTSAGALATTIANNAVTNAKAAQMNTLTIKGNNTGGTANAADLTVAQVNAILPVFTTTLNGLVNAPGSATGKVLSDNGTWVTNGTGSTNTSVGGAFRFAINGTNNIKSAAAGYGVIIDSVTSNVVTFTVDTTKISVKGTDSLFVHNVGTSGLGLLYSGADTLYGKKLVAGANITLTQNSDSSITITSSGGGASGILYIGAVNSQPAQANGAFISGDTLYLQYESSSVPGLLSTTTQTIAGSKTFSSAPSFSTLTTNNGVFFGNGSGTLLQTGAGSSTQVLHGGSGPSFSAVNQATDITGITPVANGGTGTATPNLIAGTGVTITGTWPNQTINASTSGTVTSIAVSGGTTGLTTSGGPITSSGTITFSGTLVPANGGTGLSSLTPYAILAGGSTSTGTLQQVSGVGTSGQLLTSNGAGNLPSWQNAPTSPIFNNGITNTAGTVQLGGNIIQATSVNLQGTQSFVFANAAAGASKGFRVDFTNNGSDAGYDIFYKDSVTGFWTRLPKGSIGQSLQMLGAGGIGWANQSGGGSGSLTVQRVTSGTSGTVTGGNYIYVIDPSSTITTYVTTLPASPSDGQVVVMVFGGTLTSGTIVTNLTVLPNGSQHLIDNTPPGSATADNSLKYYYVNANTTWYRFKP